MLSLSNVIEDDALSISFAYASKSPFAFAFVRNVSASVLSTATHFILKKYKDHGTILAKKEVDERMQVTP